MRRMISVCMAAAMAVAASGSAIAQDMTAQANYATFSLQSGFQPDPNVISLTAGGNLDVSKSHPGCAGRITSAPDVELTFEAGGLPLIVSVSSGSDTTLVINAPDGQWYCDDDGGEGVNPSVRFDPPGSGVYDIWVGTYGDSTAPAQLSISELSSR